MKKLNSWGVLPMRLQVPELHDGHRAIIRFAMRNHEHVLILLGVTEALLTNKDPLDFVTREYMLKSAYPNAHVGKIPDCSDDQVWNTLLDQSIAENTMSTTDNIVLYGSRDSFLKTYKGNYTTCLLDEIDGLSGTEIRNEINQTFPKTSEGRAGVIYASVHRHSAAYPAVDIAVHTSDYKQVLLGRKKFEKQFRFIGGFFDPTKDGSYEEAAFREVGEEAPEILTDGVSSFVYITSRKQKDWRYTATKDCIMTALFSVQYHYGNLTAGDDLEELRLFPLIPETEDTLISEHQELYKAFLTKIKSR